MVKDFETGYHLDNPREPSGITSILVRRRQQDPSQRSDVMTEAGLSERCEGGVRDHVPRNAGSF